MFKRCLGNVPSSQQEPRLYSASKIYCRLACLYNMYNGVLPSHKKEWKLAICNNIDGFKGQYAKWNEKDK